MPKQEINGAILRKLEVSGEDLYVLVQDGRTGEWSFPKEVLNKGEHPYFCALRGVTEETGITELPPPIDYRKIGDGKYFIFHVSKVVLLIPKEDRGIVDTKWVTLKEMEGMQINADVRKFVGGKV